MPVDVQYDHPPVTDTRSDVFLYQFAERPGLPGGLLEVVLRDLVVQVAEDHDPDALDFLYSALELVDVHDRTFPKIEMRRDLSTTLKHGESGITEQSAASSSQSVN